MRITKHDRVAGYPALGMKRICRLLVNPSQGLTTTEIAHRLMLPMEEVTTRVTALYQHGFLTDHKTDFHRWFPTLKGQSLGKAATQKPITRRTTTARLHEVVKHLRALPNNMEGGTPRPTIPESVTATVDWGWQHDDTTRKARIWN